MTIQEYCKVNGKEDALSLLKNKADSNLMYNYKGDIEWICKNGHSFFKSPWDVFVHKRFCPYCAGKKVYPGESLSDKFPDIALEWDYNKNGRLKPSEVLPYSNKKVWWKCERGHSWEAIINNRTSKHSGCPQCNSGSQSSFMEQSIYSIVKHTYVEAKSREKLWGFEYDIIIPNLVCIEYNGRFYHSDINDNNPGVIERDRIKARTAKDNGYTFIAINETYGGRSIRIEDTDIYFNANTDKLKAIKNIIKALNTVFSRLGLTNLDDSNIDIQYLKHDIHKKHEETSLYSVRPEIAAEWDYAKNGELKPQQFKPQSNVKVWWKCSNCGHEWITSIAHRVANNTGCPACLARSGSGSGSHLVITGVNDLKTLRPDLFCQIDKEYCRNKGIDIDRLAIKSNKRIHWLCNKCGGSWEAPVSRRVGYGYGCPYCSNRKLLTGYNDLRTVNADLADEFDNSERNTNKASQQLAFTYTKGHWKCKICGNIWEYSIYDRVKNHGACPVCRNNY